MKEAMGKEQSKKDLRLSEEEEKEEDTLSLSDLVINDDTDSSEEWENKCYDSKSSSSTSSTSLDHDEDDLLFEFSNNKNINAILPENILFCGKLIPYRNTMSPPVKRQEKQRSSSFSRRKLLGYCPTHHEIMELKDLKDRQNRKVIGAGIISDYKYDSRGKGKEKGKGILWSLIKALSCTTGGASYHAQSAVKASINCISLV